MDIGQPSDPVGRLASPLSRRRPGARRLLSRVAILAIAIAVLATAGRWLHYRFTHVFVDDARIAADMVVLGSRVAGWVATVNVMDSDEAAQGRVLAVIDGRETVLLLDEIDARLAAAAARQAEIEARIVMIDHQTTSQGAAQTARVDATGASLAAMNGQFDLAQTEFNRARQLASNGAGTVARLDQARASLNSGRHDVLRLHAEVANARATLAQVAAAREEMTVLRRQIATLAAEERALRAQREAMALRLADRTVVIPFDGVVDRVFVDAGEFVTPGQRLIMVHDPARVRVDANVKETDLRYFRLGMRVTISVDAYPDLAIEGTVERIGSAATSEFALLPNPNPSGNFTRITQRVPVRVAIPRQDSRLRPGMMVQLEATMHE